MLMQGHLNWQGAPERSSSTTLLDPLFLRTGSPSVGSMHMVLMVWHFHKEMDVVGSIRQHSDIYIRKNGCCSAIGKEKEAGEEQQHGVITPSTLMFLDNHFAPPAMQQVWCIQYFFTPSAALSCIKGKMLTYVRGFYWTFFYIK